MTDEERRVVIKWAKKLERLLLHVPPGVELVASGDADIGVIDRKRAGDADLHDGKWCAFEITWVRSGCKIHNVSN